MNDVFDKLDNVNVINCYWWTSFSLTCLNLMLSTGSPSTIMNFSFAYYRVKMSYFLHFQTGFRILTKAQFQ